MLTISPEEIKALNGYIHEISGIYLSETKKYLLETRLAPLVQEQGCASYLELCHKAKADTSRRLERKIIDAISTNETMFFRDTGPFELLRHKIFPELLDARAPRNPLLKTPLKIWSAASSTGQEAYSVAIVLLELLRALDHYSITLLGTDISDAAITQASSGRYNKFEIERGLSRDRVRKYFTPSGQTWKVKGQLRSMVSFRRLNLMEPFTGLGRFDLILCRNVAIYFTMEDRQKLFNQIADALEPDGYLLIGATESLNGVYPRFIPKRYLRSIFYQLK